MIDAPATATSEIESVCKAAHAALDLLRQCGIESAEDLRISIREELVHPAGLPVFAFFHAPENQIEITDFETFKSLIQPGNVYFRLPQRSLYESLIAHEVTHAVTCRMMQGIDCKRIALEYMASVIQVATMSDESRQILLDAFPASGPVELEVFNLFNFYSAPQWFVANAYRHYRELDNSCGFLQDILAGKVMFLCDI